MTAKPTAIWRVIAPPRARDGDSIYLIRERDMYRDDEEIIIKRDARLTLCRLVWLKCPEISGPNADPVNGPKATRDAQGWLDRAWAINPIEVIQYGDEKYGRPLVDIRSAGESLSVWMVTEKKWEVYR